MNIENLPSHPDVDRDLLVLTSAKASLDVAQAALDKTVARIQENCKHEWSDVRQYDKGV